MRSEKQRANDERLRAKLKAPDPSEKEAVTDGTSISRELGVAVLIGVATGVFQAVRNHIHR